MLAYDSYTITGIADSLSISTLKEVLLPSATAALGVLS